MSKKFLKHQAEELLSSELTQIKGGIDPQDIADDCGVGCQPGCLTCSSSCATKAKP